MKPTSSRPWPFLAVMALVLAGCGAASPGSRPDDMSQAGHQAAASQHSQTAQTHEQRYDPKAEATRARTGPAHSPDIWPDRIYNPTERHLGEAKEHREEARQHRAAAEALARYEGATCGEFPQATRVKCPLLGPIASLAEIDGGVRIHLEKGVPVKAVLAHMQCHHAFGRSMGHQGMPGCPLYLRNLQIRLSKDGAAVEMVSEDAGTATEIRRRTRAHLAR